MQKNALCLAPRTDTTCANPSTGFGGLDGVTRTFALTGLHVEEHQ